jgi:L-2-hydroxyglutarate oxidase LhgO
VPTPTSLGIHTAINLAGGVRLGPNSTYISSIEYDVDPNHLDEFYDQAHTYLSFLEKSDLRPDQSGIRPKLQGPTDGFTDFVINNESDNGLPGFINCIGLESPALTGCLSIAEYIQGLV